MITNRRQLKSVCKKMGLDSVSDVILQHAKESIRLEPISTKKDKDIKIGESKIGGLPDLPPV